MKKIDLKKIMLYGLPVVMIIFVIILFKDGREDFSFEKNEGSTLLIPDASQDTRTDDKVVAYKQDKQNRLSRQREKEESQVRGKDFFFDLGDDDQWETTKGKVSKENKDSISPADLYEEVVMKKGGGRKNYEQIRNNKELQKDKMVDEFNKMQKSVDSIKLAAEQEQKRISLTPDGRRVRNTSTSTIEGGNKLISACIHGDQEITSGGVVRMRLLEPLIIDRVTFPENTLFFGKARIDQDRIQVRVENLKIGEKIVTVSCDIYDNDALIGLNLPDNIKNELAKRAKQGAIDGVYPPTGGGDIFSSTLSSVVSGAKSVIRSNETQIKVSLKANYKLFIKEI